MARTDLRYQIVDEPPAGPLARFAMPPILPFFAFMLFPLAGIPLLLFNTIALKGRTWGREIILLAFAGAMRFGIPYSLAVWLHGQGVPIGWFGYLHIIPLGVSLYLAYRVFYNQSITHQIRTYFSPQGVRG